MSAGVLTVRDRPYAPLALPAFRWFLYALLSSTLGQQIVATVVGWQIYDLTRDPFSIGLVGLAEAVPYLTVNPMAGFVADSRDRCRVAVVALLAMALCATGLLALAASGAVRHGAVPIYLLIVLGGIARSFLVPARTALAADLVPRHLYARASAWRSSVWQLAAVGGPAAGGLLYAIGGPRASYATAAMLMLVALLCLTRVARVPRRPANTLETSFRTGLRAAVRFLRGEHALFGAMLLDLFSVLFGGATALLPVFAAEVLHVGPGGLGMLRSAPAAGALLMSFALAHGRSPSRPGRALLAAAAAFGCAMVAFALSRSFGLSALFLAASGACDMVSVIIRSTMLQVLTPAHLRGRVASLSSMFTGSSNEIGAFESGAAARLLGLVPSVVLGGAVTVCVAAAIAWRVPALRALRRLR